jgi:hypothetical protein
MEDREMKLEMIIRKAFDENSKELKTYYPGIYGEFEDMPRERNLTFHIFH